MVTPRSSRIGALEASPGHRRGPEHHPTAGDAGVGCTGSPMEPRPLRVDGTMGFMSPRLRQHGARRPRRGVFSARWRPVEVPADLDDSAPRQGHVRLPAEIAWSGQPDYDLTDRQQLRRVYEGRDDGREYVAMTVQFHSDHAPTLATVAAPARSRWGARADCLPSPCGSPPRTASLSGRFSDVDLTDPRMRGARRERERVCQADILSTCEH